MAELAARQAGVVSRAQVHAVGLTDGAVRSRLEQGRWRRLLPGTYATFSGAVPRAALRWAAVLYAGSGALLSHDTAAELLRLCAERAGPIHVTVPRHRRLQPQRGLVVHHSVWAEAARHPTHLPPVTRIEETVVDLTQTAPSVGDAVGWLARACSSRLTTADRLQATFRGRPRVRWRQPLAEALREVHAGCHSALELAYLTRVERAHGLPRGARQARSGTRTRSRYDDVRYIDYGLAVELDGRAAHPEQRRGFDRRRDNDTVLSGAAVLRFGWDDVSGHPC
ncbi:MAG: type IV toxin-antitoxin system AbiEi family antitoxin domain-containing protein, partial [Dactylosporangium sp.]|nr:type IV toxin-antitoxin system AbiEi family antitoxin domain-containing protein [Dactylosporangium sp.]NNJ62278.1 type IV toxin-antitoxin system AbiEi family antitoxin domain-containing protein [Dactylosporangium sp.]